MLNLHDIPGTRYEQLPVAATDVNTNTATIVAWAAPYVGKIASVEFVGVSAVTGANTNSRNLNVKLADGTEIGNVDFAGGTNAAAGTPKALTLTGTAAQLTLAAGASILIDNEKVGNGLALPAGSIRVGYKGA